MGDETSWRLDDLMGDTDIMGSDDIIGDHPWGGPRRGGQAGHQGEEANMGGLPEAGDHRRAPQEHDAWSIPQAHQEPGPAAGLQPRGGARGDDGRDRCRPQVLFRGRRLLVGSTDRGPLRGRGRQGRPQQPVRWDGAQPAEASGTRPTGDNSRSTPVSPGSTSRSSYKHRRHGEGLQGVAVRGRRRVVEASESAGDKKGVGDGGEQRRGE